MVGAPHRRQAYAFQSNGLGGFSEIKLTGSTTTSNGDFGASVAVSDGTVVVGSPGAGSFQSGKAFVFTPDGMGGYSRLELVASDAASAALFGNAVAISGTTIVVGAYHDAGGVSNSGSAYVFTPDGAGGYSETKLRASDAASDDFFGASVGVSGGTVAVGAYGDDDDGSASGSVYVFTPNGVGGYTEAKLRASDAASGDLFGSSVSMSGNTVVVGAYLSDGGARDTGKAYVYEPDGLGGHHETKLLASDGALGDQFGLSVAVSGSTVVIGARHATNPSTWSGAAYVYEPDGLGGYSEAKLRSTETDNDFTSGDLFGHAVGISGTTVVVGAPSDDQPTTDAGSANVFGPRLPPAPGGYSPVAPSRLLDTRVAGQGPCLSGSSGRNLTVVGLSGVPDDAPAVALNVTVTQPAAGGHLTVSPTGQLRPLASNLNYTTGQTIPNMVIAKVGSSGRINLFASAGCPHVIVDLAGSFEPGPPDKGGFTAVTPARVFDTRTPDQGPCVSEPGGQNVTVAGVAGIPDSAAAVALNVTVTRPTAGGHLTVSPTGQARPTTSNLNYVQGLTIANMVIAKPNASGRINVFASSGCPHVIIDIAGWFGPGVPEPGGYSPVGPSRVLDTRTAGQGPCVSGTAGRNLTVGGLWGVPIDADAVVLNVTVTRPTSGGHLTVSPAGLPRPLASNLNYTLGQTIPNLVIAKLGSDQQINLFASGGCPHVIVDVAGWFAASTAGGD